MKSCFINGLAGCSLAAVSPSMVTLTLLKWQEDGHTKRFRLIDKVQSKWRDFGTLLGLAGQLTSWESEYRIRCLTKVMTRWLDGGGGGDYPPTWEGLYTLLEDVECVQVTKELKEAVAASSC